MTELTKGFWHRLRETVTHWIVGGAVLLVTGLVPEEWLARMVEKLHVSAGALHLWSVGLDARAVLMIFGVALIAGDILWRRHLRAVPVPSSAPSPPTVERGSIAVLPAANLAGDAGRTDEGFWVAVLPFKYGGGNADLISLAEALSDEIVTGLSRFSYLRVISRSSTSRYVNATADVRTIGREIGARYVMEGSLHHAGTRVRLAVQLVDAVSGAHLWAENYERTFRPDLVFELQDDLAARIRQSRTFRVCCPGA